MVGWKYSKQWLQKHPYVAKVVRAKKVICICGAVIKFNRKYDEDYINRHANGPGCKRKDGQRSILCFFAKSTTDKDDDIDIENSDDDWDNWESEVEDTMDDDDIITVDEAENEISEENNNIIINPTYINQVSNKRKGCLGLCSDLITNYVDRTPASYGGARRVEVIAKEMFPNKFPHKFTRKKLTTSQKRALNRKIYAESQWRVDKECVAVRAKTCTGYSEKGICDECLTLKHNNLLENRLAVPKPAPQNLKFTPKFYFETNSLKKHLQNQDLREIWSIVKDDDHTNIWITLADKAIHGVFNEKPVFEGLCEIMVQASIRKDNNKGKQNFTYNEEFTNFLIILGSFSTRALDIFRQNLEGRTIQNIRKLRTNDEDTLTNPTFSFKNVAKFKRLIDTLNYQGPIAAMSDNTKLKPALRYHSGLGCIVGSTLSIEETKINAYKDIPIIINDIKIKKTIANDVRAYILQVVPLPNFPPVVIALIANTGSDNQSTVTNFHQELLTQMAPQLNLSILSIGSDGHIVEFKAQTAIQRHPTDERLVFQNDKFGINFSCPIFPNVGPVVRVQDPKHAKKTSRNAIMSDDGAAYRVFCSGNLQNCYGIIKQDMRGIFVYLFIMGELIDSYLNREIIPLERIKMSMTAFFFLQLWKKHIANMSEKHPDFISLNKNFLADQSFAIFISLAESMILLVISHREYYLNYPFLPWMHGSEACEHFFGIARQINSDFNYFELLQLVPKISQYAKALRAKNIILEKEKSVREGYHFDYNVGDINSRNLATLCTWLSDAEITLTIEHSYELASELANALDIDTIQRVNPLILQPYVLIEKQNSEISAGIEPNSEIDEFSEINREISDAIDQASKHAAGSNGIFDSLNSEDNTDDRIHQKKIISILNATKTYNNEEQTHDPLIRYLLPTKELDYLTMIALRRHHEAYNSRPIERQYRVYYDKQTNTGNINPNKASQIVSHFTNNNDPTVHYIKPREKRWKENWKTMAMSLANLQNSELSKQKRTIHNYNRKTNNAIMYIESANVTQDFPLRQDDFVIVIYGKKICVAKIIAMYYEGYGNHCYTQDAINQIEDLSYISLQVYLPIHLNIFASQTLEGYVLFTHRCPQNILYHINTNELIISKSSLTLIGMARNTFNYFNRDDIRNTIINMM
ncbi:hypothetical protein RirG_057140 [Rhizophagus irregularis DAOM 197198w]|uniref:Uncharacterized protein n=2 Tax=Rhizophagus irregularis TaxID=588596 RepID=A0A015L1Y8_RHIIW|nr:hypothetical protein RirG_057140 [Rhizophagus irregularis DAOM 197198w]